MIPVLNTHQGPVVYWPYPSPPVSPSNSFYAAQAQAAAAAAIAAQQSMAGPAIVLMRGLPFNASTTDILAFFQGYSDVRFSHCSFVSSALTVGPVSGDSRMRTDPASGQRVADRRRAGHFQFSHGSRTRRRREESSPAGAATHRALPLLHLIILLARLAIYSCTKFPNRGGGGCSGTTSVITVSTLLPRVLPPNGINTHSTVIFEIQSSIRLFAHIVFVHRRTLFFALLVPSPEVRYLFDRIFIFGTNWVDSTSATLCAVLIFCVSYSSTVLLLFLMCRFLLVASRALVLFQSCSSEEPQCALRVYSRIGDGLALVPYPIVTTL